jgi:hypothetical protein
VTTDITITITHTIIQIPIEQASIHAIIPIATQLSSLRNAPMGRKSAPPKWKCAK